jgi:hypothetical protein
LAVQNLKYRWLDFSDAFLLAACSSRPKATVLDLPKNHGEHTEGYRTYSDVRLGQALFEWAFNQPMPDFFRRLVALTRFWKYHKFLPLLTSWQKSCPACIKQNPPTYLVGAAIIFAILVIRQVYIRNY